MNADKTVPELPTSQSLSDEYRAGELQRQLPARAADDPPPVTGEQREEPRRGAPQQQTPQKSRVFDNLQWLSALLLRYPALATEIPENCPMPDDNSWYPLLQRLRERLAEHPHNSPGRLLGSMVGDPLYEDCLSLSALELPEDEQKSTEEFKDLIARVHAEQRKLLENQELAAATNDDQKLKTLAAKAQRRAKSGTADEPPPVADEQREEPRRAAPPQQTPQKSKVLDNLQWLSALLLRYPALATEIPENCPLPDDNSWYPLLQRLRERLAEHPHNSSGRLLGSMVGDPLYEDCLSLSALELPEDEQKSTEEFKDLIARVHAEQRKRLENQELTAATDDDQKLKTLAAKAQRLRQSGTADEPPPVTDEQREEPRRAAPPQQTPQKSRVPPDILQRLCALLLRYPVLATEIPEDCLLPDDNSWYPLLQRLRKLLAEHPHNSPGRLLGSMVDDPLYEDCQDLSTLVLPDDEQKCTEEFKGLIAKVHAKHRRRLKNQKLTVAKDDEEKLEVVKEEIRRRAKSGTAY